MSTPSVPAPTPKCFTPPTPQTRRTLSEPHPVDPSILASLRTVTPHTTTGVGFTYRSNQLALTNMPLDLILVRHGESEGNLVKDRKDDTVWDGEFGARHTSKYRLTDRGRQQAKIAGDWLQEHFPEGFDMCFSSEYVRAIETAAHLELPDAIWSLDRYLRERDNGIFSGRSNIQNQTQYSAEKKRRERDQYYYSPPGGESVAMACQRVEMFLDSLSGRCAGLRVVCVVHRNIMEAFRIILESIPQIRFDEVFRQGDASGEMDNCTILHYTRKCPGTKDVSSHLNWVRTVLPWRRIDMGWKEIVRPRFSSAELLQMISAVPQLINNTEAELEAVRHHDNPAPQKLLVKRL